MINQTLALVQGAVGANRPPILGLQVAQNNPQTPLPTDFADPLFVINAGQPESFWTVPTWIAASLPTGGDPCTLLIDHQGGYVGIVGVQSASPTLTGAAWQTPTLINSWTNVGGGFEVAGYLLDPLGFVHLKGVLTTGTSSTVAFILPAGFRPGATTSHPNTEISVTGNVLMTGTNPQGLSGITFLAEN